ncbi:MAG TPA: sulfotransferase domain-containing protein [Methylocystis sp.]|nr:sulfotransferase domain-containing protein [Methylocystis sp.]
MCSHERSGTHFLMNTIGHNSIYCSNPWVDFDIHPLAAILNFHSPRSISSFFEALYNIHCASLVKSHFPACFFYLRNDFFLKNNIKFVYIYRNPVDVMISYKRFIDTCPWSEGPKKSTVAEFALSAPEGQMMRYQNSQESSLVARWEDHVSGWLKAAEREDNVLCVSYHDLKDDFENEHARIFSFLELPRDHKPIYPDYHRDVIEVDVGQAVEGVDRRRLEHKVYHLIRSDRLRTFCRATFSS